jgi:hypothetical protein
MRNQLQEKDDHWRSRPNASTPVMDPGLSTLGTDDEAGGGSAYPSVGGTERTHSRAPLERQVEAGNLQVRLVPAFWHWLAFAVLSTMTVLAIFSL